MKTTDTRIYATIGPSCDSAERIEQMIRQGMTGVRLNLSHAGLDKCRHTLQQVHRAFKACGREPELLIDMQGPEMRIGKLASSRQLNDNDLAAFSPSGKPIRQSDRLVQAHIPVKPSIFHTLSVGQKVTVDDGKLLFQITEVSAAEAISVVLRGGMLLSNKSIAIEGIPSDLPPLTETDYENISLAKKYGVTGLMQPFVRNATDLQQVRTALSDAGAGLRLFAKIENREGLEHLDEILPEADEIIIARGDLGNAMPLWELPVCQRRISECCKKHQKPFMVVTQMLASMEHCAVPTRAEVNDIFHAVLDGAASVMVTGETAVGEYPVEVIRYLANTCREAENYRKKL